MTMGQVHDYPIRYTIFPLKIQLKTTYPWNRETNTNTYTHKVKWKPAEKIGFN